MVTELTLVQELCMILLIAGMVTFVAALLLAASPIGQALKRDILYKQDEDDE